MAVQLFNLAGMACSATGTNTLTLTSALPGFSSLADAGVTDGDEVRYLIKDGNNRELGRGTYTASGVTISRDTVLQSISGGVTGTSKISLSGTSEVYLTLAAEDLSNLVAFADTFTLPTTDGTTGQVLQTDGSGTLSFADVGGGGGGLVPIGAPVVSVSDGAVDFALTGYDSYVIRISRFVPSTTATLHLRTSSDGGSGFDAGASDYGWSYAYIQATLSGADDTLDDRIDIAQAVGTGSARALSGDIHITPSDGSVNTIINFHLGYQTNTGATAATVGSGCRFSSTAVDAMRIFPSSGTFAGIFQLYGKADGS